jgi:hypothetical protein
MMIDADGGRSLTTTYRVLSAAERLNRRNRKPLNQHHKLPRSWAAQAQ